MAGKSRYAELSKKNDVLVIDLVKKLLTLSVGGVLFTEETIRKSITELKLSKDIANFIVQQSTKSKDELLRFLSEEIVKAMKDVKIEKEIRKVLETYKVSVTMEINFEPSEKKSLKAKAKLSRKQKSETAVKRTARSKALKPKTTRQKN